MTQDSQIARRRTEGADPAPESTGQTGSLLADLRGGGGEGQSETPQPARARRSFPTQHLVTMLVLVAGGGALLAMRQYGMGAGMNFDTAVKIDYVETASHKRTPEQQRILIDLERGVTATAPQAEDIHKNPFKLVVGPPPVTPDAPPDPDADAKRAAEERQRRQEDTAAALANVVVNSVMGGGGGVSMARVNGEIVRVGDTVSELFTVAAIQGRSILLTADGQVFVVEMSQEADSRPQPQVRTRTPGK
jgi:hypothetical protein